MGKSIKELKKRTSFLDIRKDDENKFYIHYLMIGRISEDNKFNGLVQGYENTGEDSSILIYNSILVYNNKALPIFDEDKSIEIDSEEIERAFTMLDGVDYDDLYSFVSDSIEYSNEEDIWKPKEHLINSLSLNENTQICMDNFKITPFDYGNTIFNNKISYWEVSELIELLKANCKDELYTVIDDYIENYDAFPVDVILFMDTPFQFTIDFNKYKKFLGKKAFNSLSAKIKS